MSAAFDPGPGWREVPYGARPAEPGWLMECLPDGTEHYWVREVPVPPLPTALFDLAEFGLEIHPTIAMRDGRQAVFQCSRCGLVAVQTNLAPGPLGACPACGDDTWHRQQLPVAGLHRKKVS